MYWTDHLKEVELAAESIGFTTRNIVGRGRVDGDDAGWSAQILAKRTVDEAEITA